MYKHILQKDQAILTLAKNSLFLLGFFFTHFFLQKKIFIKKNVL